MLLKSREFTLFRKKLNKTQKQIAQLLGTSLKAIHSYEQGWRSIPAHAERQLLFLTAMKVRNNRKQKSCWIMKKCPSDQKDNCPASEFNTGDLCWFINGTICDGYVHTNWKEKMNICRGCSVYKNTFDI
jgi:hypothetical protein